MFSSLLIYSAGERWTAVPLVSFHVPSLGLFFWVNTWAISSAVAVLAAALSNSQNHHLAQAGTRAISSLRKAIASFWRSQILERLHLKWRSFNRRRVAPMAVFSNRLPSAWIYLRPIQGKTTQIWVVVLFFILLTSNSFGLVPLCSAVTGQAGTTLGLSLALWTAITLRGINRLGLRFVKLFLPSGPSWPMAPLFILLESISYSFRAIRLGVRLWANLLSGHMLIHMVSALALAPALACSFIIGAPITIIVSALLMALTGLETIVCVLQSGVFCLLASFYLHEGLSKKDALANPLSYMLF